MARLVIVMFEREGNMEDADVFTLSTESQGVLVEVLRRRSSTKKSSLTTRTSTMSRRMSEQSAVSSCAASPCLQGLSMEPDEIYSWGLDLLAMNTSQLQNVA